MIDLKDLDDLEEQMTVRMGRTSTRGTRRHFPKVSYMSHAGEKRSTRSIIRCMLARDKKKRGVK